MIARVPFHWYAGDQLAALLPYRKRMFLFGPKVCEWAAVLPMTTSGFFLGSSLALCNRPAAEEILAEAAKPQPWRVAFSHIVQDSERRNQGMNAATVTFESFVPEVISNKFKALLLTP